MTDLTQTRDDFVAYVRRQLVGPFDGPAEIIFDPPNRRYLMGILFPRQVAFEGYLEAEGEERDETSATDTGEESQFSDDPVSAANDYLPASQGLSFFTTAPELIVRARAAEYETLSGVAAEELLKELTVQGRATEELLEEDPRRNAKGSSKIWRRHQLDEAIIKVGATDKEPTAVWGDRAEVHVRWRSYPHGSLVTITLVNAREADDEHPDRHWDEMLMQVEFDVTVPAGFQVLEYPSVALASHDPEEDELRLIHRAAKVYAIGHGCSPEWSTSAGVASSVRSEVMPSHIVPRVSADGDAAQALDVAWLADESVSAEVLQTELNAFIDPYEDWIDKVKTKADGLGDRYRGAATSIIERLERALERMRDGARVFAEHPDRVKILDAFRLANHAMLIQMRHSQKDMAGSRRPLDAAPDMPTTYGPGASWRPFQLGFFLTTLRGLVDDQHDDRDVVDLIWFPTGGGKTEAYLLVAAFEIFRRRLVLGDTGGGTAVVSRYTLSLLTADQFKRTASTTAACEYLRRRRSGLGDEPISVGLWVGEATSPNRYAKARERFEELRDSIETDERFLLDRCPWCGTEIVPRKHHENDALYGITSTDRSFVFNCPSTKCEFHEQIPVQVIDDGLYEAPPTFLLGTVDKFAQLAWVPESGVLFGRSVGNRPPTLIIQDELHLLTGPLGTTVGLYEAAINLLCEVDDRPPKVISSTATIRRASAQIKGLFGRRVDLFPPSGIDADDSYFARVDEKTPGRLYVGMMAQGHTSDTAVVHTGTALLQAPVDLDLSGDAQDAYWTVVAYHSSLRELGRTVTIARDDINTRLGSLVVGRPRREYDVEELSSSVPRALQPRLLERLNLPVSSGSVIDFLASTNMLSVGVDVPRLGLMLVNGQPKATAEYIQATSRVGRSTAPGLVFGLFRSTKPRDRSHYENFRAFHSALYRHVEPTTVTPYSPPSRDRALHAALVILARHRLGMQSDGSAGKILDRRSEVESMAAKLVDIVGRVEPRERQGAKQYLDHFIEDWVERAERADEESKLLYYKPNGKGQINLIRQYNTKAAGWQTLGSMRNVDMESLIEVASSGGAAAKGGLMQRKVRQSQTIVPFGVGAIFDLQGESLVACDTFRWGARGERIQSERLAAVLGVSEFRAAPAVASNAWAAPSAGVPYARFPAWLFCQKCRRMTRWSRALEQSDKVPTCGSCPGKKQLVPMRWIQICPNGHMDDLDWKRWAHSRNTSPEARRCQKDNLFFESVSGKGSGGLDTLQVHCHSCHSRRSLMGITSKGSLKTIGVTCIGRQPWQRWNERVDCEEVPLAVQRGASNVYFPLVHSSIEIPNASRADSQSEKALAIKADDFFRALLGVSEDAPMFDMMVDTLVKTHDVTPEYVKGLVRDEKQRVAGKATAVEATPGDLLGEEWAAFLTELDNADDPHFRTRHVELVQTTDTPVSSLLADRVDKVVLADRLREVRALEGFHRVTPAGGDKLVPVALNHKATVDWLPAIDVRGEGIFLSLDEGRLSVWEEQGAVRDRVLELEKRLGASFMEPRLRERTGPILAPRYVLLHTFAHLLIRRLAFESGYAATSLRERIYARTAGEPGGASKQAGILIYTAAGDSEGTLGGLVRQGEPPQLQGTVLEALQDAMWCSSDPLCSENLASTFASLNFAACHACTLVAETSCESGNYLLDRVLVVGSDRVPGFFQDVLDAAVNAAGEGIRGIS